MSFISKIKKDDTHFIKDIINGMYDWVRVIDKDNNIIFLNDAMAEGVGSNSIGIKCYNAIGKSSPCENCVSRKAIFDGKSYEKEEVMGNRIFSVMSSPLTNNSGEVIAAVEVLRDITDMKQLQKKIAVQNNKLQEELLTAKRLQYSLLPWNFSDKRISFSFRYNPCEALGGDFLDIFNIDDDHIGLYIADVSGHGVPASMLTVYLRSAIDKKSLSPSAALEKLYTDFNSSNILNDLYITVFYAVINLKDHTITFSNAGHNVIPILFNQNNLEILSSAGIPISDWLISPQYQDHRLPFYMGDRLFLYTDGLVEIRNVNNEQYGEERLLNILLGSKNSIEYTLDEILSQISVFVKDEQLINSYDDITMALLELFPKS
ncbi:MAG: putative sensor protein [Clostridiales bacterium]|jgi:sigma-B regulation protein RsbU (phosphoserine phosphatase)|nr:putative sensor protein [Clostridiales bacterium]